MDRRRKRSVEALLKDEEVGNWIFDQFVPQTQLGRGRLATGELSPMISVANGWM